MATFGKINLFAVLLGVLLFAWSGFAKAESFTFQVRSYHPNIVQLEFYSQNSNRAWPGGSRAYELKDYKVHEYRLNCRRGEKICFGAWVKGNSNTYWGVGAHNRNRCSNCCYTCNGGRTEIRNLQP